MTAQLNTTQALASKVSGLLDDCSWDTEEMAGFITELHLINITTAEKFEDRFVFNTRDYRPHRDFVQYLVWEVFGWADDIAELKGLVIDWDASWSLNYRNHYDCIYYDRAHFYFNDGKQARLPY